MKLSHKKTRFLALNKAKPLGGFWESSDPDEIERISKKPVTIDIYDIQSNKTEGSYALLEKKYFYPDPLQLKKAPDLKKNPKQETVQSPLEITSR